jgi:Uri superfamily endonuclease
LKSAIDRGQVSPGSLPGTYILLMRLPRGQALTIGYLGRREFARGWYLYVGSAFGPGGVAARCNHHRRVSTRPRWHIDYLRQAALLRAIWFSHEPTHLEHAWAGVLAGQPGLSLPVRGFGASDCDCPGHLFYSASRPDIRHFSAITQSESGGNAQIYHHVEKNGDKCH